MNNNQNSSQISNASLSLPPVTSTSAAYTPTRNVEDKPVYPQTVNPSELTEEKKSQDLEKLLTREHFKAESMRPASSDENRGPLLQQMANPFRDTSAQ